MTDHSSSMPRRRFLGTLAIAGSVIAAPSGPLFASTGAESDPFDGPGDWDHSWLNKLSAKHRTFFDNKTMGGDALAYPKRYFDAMVDGYGAAPKDIQVVVGFAGTGWPIALKDEKWAAWGLTPSANGAAPGKNPVLGTAADDPATSTTIMAWKKRGAIFLVCNNALKKGAAEIAAKNNGDATAIHAEMRAAILPEFIVVPAMVAALAMAQEKDCAYLVGS